MVSEYIRLIRRVQKQARAWIPDPHVCADCGKIIPVPRVYCDRCERIGEYGMVTLGRSNPRGMLIYYGYEGYE